MPLALNARGVGRVTIVECSGRIVAGKEMESLRAQITGMMRDRKDFVLHLGAVGFIDSSGLGTMVRLLTATRRSHGDLKLCNVPAPIAKLLTMTNLNKLFEAHDSEEGAIAAFYRRTVPEHPANAGPAVLCVEQNSDVLAYLRELLKRGGYEVHTSSNVRDALILMRVTCPALVVLGTELSASPAIRMAFDEACARVPLVELSGEFSTLEAGEAGSRLLESIQVRLQAKPTANA